VHIFVVKTVAHLSAATTNHARPVVASSASREQLILSLQSLLAQLVDILKGQI